MELESLYAIYQRHPVICTDTRKITPGCLFVALQGAQFDGNSFAMEALKLGAAFALVSDPTLSGDSFIQCENTLSSLQSLANFHRRQLPIPLVAITGTNGKTTTKELTTCVLSETYKVHGTKGNLNNHIGVPLTLLSTPVDTEIIVCEMGANHIGEIDMLCKIAMPTHGIITNIGKAHLEGFGSIEGVQKAKGELYDYLHQHGGFAFVNADDPRVMAAGKGLADKITYGFNPVVAPQVCFNYSANKNENGFVINDLNSDTRIISGMFGFYNAANVLAAYTIGLHFNVPKQKMIKALSSFMPGSNRSETISFKGSMIIKDAYNANPTSMELALRAFAQRFPDGWIILGDMKELGNESDNAHQQMISMIRELGFRHVMLVGDSFKRALIHYPLMNDIVKSYENIDELKRNWNWNECRNQTLLLKGSRSMFLEKLLEE